MAKGEAELELQLPEEIIQHIQCFLNGKEAAQTTLVSKSWYAAWLTRPNLDFDQKDFYCDNPESGDIGFWEFVDKTVERYETLNLKIDTLRLYLLDLSYTYTPDYRNYLVKELILKALKMGATGLDFTDDYLIGKFILPHEVFVSKNLVRLSVEGGKIGAREISCSGLKSLNLDRADVESDTIFWNIISSCPVIENLSLHPCNWQSSPFTEFGKRSLGLFNKLKSLLLICSDVDTMFFHDFSSKFPCLKDLSLYLFGGGYKAIEVSSPSLECITFEQAEFFKVKFDVPNIRKLTLLDTIPSVSFKTTSTNWSSEISLACNRSPDAEWFLKINKLLTQLSESKVSLSLKVQFSERFDCPEYIKGLHKPELENLVIYGCDEHSFNFLDALFWCCRPTYVTQDWFEFGHCHFMEIVYKRVQRVGLKGSSASQSQSVCDLEEVDVECFDEAVSAWGPRLVDFMKIVYKRVMQRVGLKGSSASQSQSLCDLEEVDVECFDEAVSAWRPRLVDFMKIVYKRVMQCVGLKGSSASQSQSLCDLEEVDVEFFDEAVSAWRPRLVDASTCPKADEQRLRLHLKWRS